MNSNQQDGDDPALWKNRHFADGELEDLEHHELIEAMDEFKKNTRGERIKIRLPRRK